MINFTTQIKSVYAVLLVVGGNFHTNHSAETFREEGRITCIHRTRAYTYVRTYARQIEPSRQEDQIIKPHENTVDGQFMRKSYHRGTCPEAISALANGTRYLWNFRKDERRRKRGSGR